MVTAATELFELRYKKENKLLFEVGIGIDIYIGIGTDIG